MRDPEDQPPLPLRIFLRALEAIGATADIGPEGDITVVSKYGRSYGPFFAYKDNITPVMVEQLCKACHIDRIDLYAAAQRAALAPQHPHD